MYNEVFFRGFRAKKDCIMRSSRVRVITVQNLDKNYINI